MTPPSDKVFHTDERPVVLLARNVSTRWLVTIVDTVLGLVMLPFNVSHLGPAAYGLWILTASITVHFSILNLGYGGAMVKFVAQYRAHRSVQALNEIASTLFFVFLAAGAAAYLVAIAIAFNIDAVFRLTPEQVEVGKVLLLLIAVPVAMNFPFSVYGGIVSGFQRFHANSVVAIASSIIVAAVNVAVLSAGYGLITLVAATTTIRVIVYFVYRWNARRIYPALRISWSLVRRERLREVTGFSLYAFVIDWANKLNYQVDTIIIGAFLGAVPVAVFTAASRIIMGTQTLTNQLNGVLFPLVVDSDASRREARLQRILLEGTQLSLLMVLSLGVGLVVLAEPLIAAWVGPEMLGSVPVLQVLAIAVVVRVGNGTATTLLKGAGGHKMLATVNLGAGIVNVALSIVLVLSIGLAGVAVATLVAVTAAAVILGPTACRRVGVPVRLLLRRSILPTVWPAVLTAGVLTVTRPVVPAGPLLLVLTHLAAGGALYLGLFFLLAVSREQRQTYLLHARALLRHSARTKAAGTSPSAAA